MDIIEATYVATRPAGDPEKLARAIAREQTVECVEELISDAIGERYLGRVAAVEHLDDERVSIVIDYPQAAAGGDLSALIQLLYGNVSFYPRIRLTRVRLPDAIYQRLPPVRAGLPGIRERLGVGGRALLGAVLKPRGSAVAELAARAEAFAAGGGDILKDDQNLVDDDLDGFRTRVGACAEAVRRGAARSGKPCLYLPFAGGAGPALDSRLACIAAEGLPGVVLCGFILGLETAAECAQRHELMWMCHPAAAGAWTEPDAHGIAPEVVFGTLVRAAGADICNFPAAGGRIAPGRPADAAIIRELIGPVPDRPPTLPCLAGGMTLDRLAGLAQEFGPDCMLLVGGDLMRTGERIEALTRNAIAALERP